MEPRYNEPLYNEVLGITNDCFCLSSSKTYGKEPRVNETLLWRTDLARSLGLSLYRGSTVSFKCLAAVSGFACWEEKEERRKKGTRRGQENGLLPYLPLPPSPPPPPTSSSKIFSPLTLKGLILTLLKARPKQFHDDKVLTQYLLFDWWLLQDFILGLPDYSVFQAFKLWGRLKADLNVPSSLPLLLFQFFPLSDFALHSIL